MCFFVLNPEVEGSSTLLGQRRLGALAGLMCSLVCKVFSQRLSFGILLCSCLFSLRVVVVLFLVQVLVLDVVAFLRTVDRNIYDFVFGCASADS